MSSIISASKHKAALARARASGSKTSEAIMEPLLHAAAGAAIAFLESKVPDTMFNGRVPTKLVGAAGLRYLALKSSGDTKRIASMGGNALAVLYGYDGMKRGTFIAG